MQRNTRSQWYVHFNVLHLEHQASLSPCSLLMCSLKFGFLITFNFEQQNGLQTNLLTNKRSFHFVIERQTFSTTFSHVGSVHVLCSIVSTIGTMMMARIAFVCRVVSLGFFSSTSHGYGTSDLLWHKLLPYKKIALNTT